MAQPARYQGSLDPALTLLLLLSYCCRAAKKRARAPEPQERYADLSSMQMTQQGDDEDDAAGGYGFEVCVGQQFCHDS